jgi:ABC-2 type transport system permease protein
VSTPSAVTWNERVPAAVAWLTRHPSARAFHTLLRREFWEYRSRGMAPRTGGVLWVLCARLTHGAMQIDASEPSEWLDPHVKRSVFALAWWGLTIPHYVVMILVLSFYLLDCLYAERKDRSILFWKSLPVSDGATVGAKLCVAGLIVPLETFLVALITNVLFTIVWDLRAVIGHAPELLVWDTVAFLKTQTLMFMGLMISILWYAPFLGALLLASAWARRNVYLWVTLVPLLTIIVERIAFGTHYIANLLHYRSVGIWGSLHLETAVFGSFTSVGQATVVSIPALYDRVHIGPAFTNIDLWLGLIFTAACVYAAVWLRRYRDDSY